MIYGSRTAGKSRLIMVLSYLESIEDPYQYGNDYGDLVEYLKMLLKGEEDYVPEEDGRIGSEKWLNDIKKRAVMREATGERDFWEKHLKDSDFWKYPKFGGDGVGHAAKDQKGKRAYINSSPFNFSPHTLKWIEENAVEPERTEYGVIIEDAVDKEDIWGLNPHSIPTIWELNEKRLDERIDELIEKIDDAKEEVDLVEEEYAYAKWKKRYEDKKFHRRVKEAIEDVGAAIAVTPETPSIGEMVAEMIRDDSSWKSLENSEEELLRPTVYDIWKTEKRKRQENE